MPRKKEDDCEFCNEHWGMKMLLVGIFVATLGNLAMLTYNTFGVTANIEKGLVRLEGKDTELAKDIEVLKERVTKLEKR